MPRIKKIVIPKIMSNNEVSSKEGTWYTEDMLKYPVITTNIDVYYIDENNNEILLL